MLTLMIYLVGIISGFCVSGLMEGANMLSSASARVTSNRHLKIVVKRVKIGKSDNFSVVSVVLRNRNEKLEGYYYKYRLLRQFDILDELVKTIVVLVTSYDLVKYYGRSELLQSHIDAFAENVNLFNLFLERTDVLPPELFEEAAMELKNANQQSLNAIGHLKDQLLSELEDSDRQLIYFRESSSY